MNSVDPIDVADGIQSVRTSLIVVYYVCVCFDWCQLKARTATGMQVDVMEDKDMYGDEDLFALSVIKVN